MSIVIRALIYMMVGITGEIIFTAIKALILKRDLRLQGYTQLWVMPMYALGGVLIFENLHFAMAGWFIGIRALVYAFVIFAMEFLVGFLGEKLTGECPWKYEGRWNVLGYIDLIKLPFWGAAGIGFELIHHFLLTF